MQKKNATTKKGSRNVMGAELHLAHDMGAGVIGGPLLVDMWPYGCFILKGFVTKTSRYFAYLSNKLCCWEVRYAITSPFCTPFYNGNWNLNESP